MGMGLAQNRRQNASSVWVQDENGKLKIVFLRTGVTDNIYTEITGGDLEEGQEVIVDEGEANEERRGGPSMMRMLR
jgi:HlyD family secretion protein